ncbi:glycerophosphodiester phosphodiesterase [Actinoplanes sp. NPDC051346]|uniref:glycerophosphodiester phosphodiesterase n=1 Tax=Actinoplanes sp. NPDC051346 TaxID=3155048 RepID=UPI003447C5DD
MIITLSRAGGHHMRASWRKAAIAAVSVLALAGCRHDNSAEAAAASCEPGPAAIAHRGGTERAMENTLGAFTAAGDAGVKVWEIDVHFDVRGTPVVLHDDTVDRVSPASGPIARLDAGDGIPTDDGQRIPTLREVYDLAGRHQAQVLTEFKTVPTAKQWSAVAAQIDATIGRRAVTLMSFDRAVVLEAARRIPDTQLALVHATGDLTPEEIKQYGGAINKHHSSIIYSRAKKWHDAGIRVYAWTVDKETDWERLSVLPIDGFVTNRPIEYTRWAAERCKSKDSAN